MEFIFINSSKMNRYWGRLAWVVGDKHILESNLYHILSGDRVNNKFKKNKMLWNLGNFKDNN